MLAAKSPTMIKEKQKPVTGMNGKKTKKFSGAKGMNVITKREEKTSDSRASVAMFMP